MVKEKSLQNLKPWTKGQSGNPTGKIPFDRETRELTNSQLKEVMDVVLTGDLEALKAIQKDPNASALKVWISAIAIKGITSGDPLRLEALLRRTVGAVKENVSVENMVVFKPATAEDLKNALATDPFIELPSESVTHLASSSVVEQSAVNRSVVGSSPTPPANLGD